MVHGEITMYIKPLHMPKEAKFVLVVFSFCSLHATSIFSTVESEDCLRACIKAKCSCYIVMIQVGDSRSFCITPTYPRCAHCPMLQFPTPFTCTCIFRPIELKVQGYYKFVSVNTVSAVTNAWHRHSMHCDIHSMCLYSSKLCRFYARVRYNI